MDRWLWWPGVFEKVIFGTDVHYSKTGQILGEGLTRLDWLTLTIDDQTRGRILRGNIGRLLGLKE